MFLMIKIFGFMVLIIFIYFKNKKFLGFFSFKFFFLLEKFWYGGLLMIMLIFNFLVSLMIFFLILVWVMFL